MHRGFLFQHLYTVQCLLSAAALSVRSVGVESDEDVEVQFEGRRIYVQVKHRKEPLAWNDIEEAVARFAELRAAHQRGERSGEPAFLIISNAAPNGPLAAKLAVADWPADVHVDWPAADPDARILPAPQGLLRSQLSQTLETILRLMIREIVSRSRTDAIFTPVTSLRPPAFFFRAEDVLVNLGYPGGQELRFKRDRAIYIRLFPTYADQPRVGRVRAIEVASRLKPPQHLFNSPSNQNEWGEVNVQPHGDGITSFTQIFETGELWGASEEPFRDKNTIAAIGVEKGFVAALDNYRLVYEKELKLQPPFTIEFGATGLKDQALLVPSVEFPSIGDHAGAIRRDNISQQYQLNGFDRTEWMTALRDFLIEFYDLAARVLAGPGADAATRRGQPTASPVNSRTASNSAFVLSEYAARFGKTGVIGTMS